MQYPFRGQLSKSDLSKLCHFFSVNNWSYRSFRTDTLPGPQHAVFEVFLDDEQLLFWRPHGPGYAASRSAPQDWSVFPPQTRVALPRGMASPPGWSITDGLKVWTRSLAHLPEIPSKGAISSWQEHHKQSARLNGDEGVWDLADCHTLATSQSWLSWLQQESNYIGLLAESQNTYDGLALLFQALREAKELGCEKAITEIYTSNKAAEAWHRLAGFNPNEGSLLIYSHSMVPGGFEVKS